MLSIFIIHVKQHVTERQPTQVLYSYGKTNKDRLICLRVRFSMYDNIYRQMKPCIYHICFFEIIANVCGWGPDRGLELLHVAMRHLSQRRRGGHCFPALSSRRRLQALSADLSRLHQRLSPLPCLQNKHHWNQTDTVTPRYRPPVYFFGIGYLPPPYLPPLSLSDFAFFTKCLVSCHENTKWVKSSCQINILSICTIF